MKGTIETNEFPSISRMATFTSEQIGIIIPAHEKGVIIIVNRASCSIVQLTKDDINVISRNSEHIIHNINKNIGRIFPINSAVYLETRHPERCVATLVDTKNKCQAELDEMDILLLKNLKEEIIEKS